MGASALSLIPLLNAATGGEGGGGVGGGGGVPVPWPEYSQQSSQTVAELVSRSQSEIISGANNLNTATATAAANGNKSGNHRNNSHAMDSLPSPRSLRESNTLRCAPTNAPTSMHSLYKTELCRSWEETGCCRYGNKCQFAHGKSELRPIARHPKYKTEICRTFATSGTCPYGTRCRFFHYVSTPKDASRSTTASALERAATTAASNGAGGGTGVGGEGSEKLVCVDDNYESSDADTWTELLDLYNETTKAAKAQAAKVKRTKSPC